MIATLHSPFLTLFAMNTKLSDEAISRACLLFVQGRTVRSLARQFNIPRSTLHDHLVRRLGVGCQRSFSGTIAVVDEYLQSPGLSRNQKAAIRRWMTQNFDKIVEMDADRTPIYTNRKEQLLTDKECGSQCDFRSNLKRMEDGYVA